MAAKLSETEIEGRLAAMPGWAHRGGGLHREYAFGGFVEAFGFMTMAAIRIEKLNHHPEWSNVYGRVTVRLATHDAGGVTGLDFQLASILDELAARCGD